MRIPMRVAATMAAVAVSVPVTMFALTQNPPGAPSRDVAAKPPVGTAAISGVVVSDDATPAPMRRVRVTVRSDAYGNGWSATTDDAGRFVIGNLPAGRYAVQASKPAWLIASYGATRPGRPGTPIAIVHCNHWGFGPFRDKDMTFILPEYLIPVGSGNRLIRWASFVDVACGMCGGPCRRGGGRAG